jgi:transcriptional regulator with XRE-family HTH domain
MLSKKTLRDSFAEALANGLRLRYREIPTAEFVAREFNRRANTTDAITQESARRWLRGLAIPDLAKLLVLRSWLDLDLNALAMPSVESIKKVDVELSGAALARQGEFIQTTQTIKQALRSLMEELERLEKQSEPTKNF